MLSSKKTHIFAYLPNTEKCEISEIPFNYAKQLQNNEWSN